jgi:hypothetical protein
VTGFPDELIELTAEAAFGADLTADPTTWTWTTLTCTNPVNPAQTISRVITDNGITIKRGIAVGGSQQATTSAGIPLFNHDGALTPQLVTSPWWPYVDAGTPIRLKLRPLADLTDTFTRTVSNGWGAGGGITWTPNSGASTFAATGTQGTETHATRNFVRLIRTDQTRDDVDVVFDATVNAVATGGACVIGPTLREQANGDDIWAELEFGLAGAVTLTVRSYIGGVFTSVAQVTVPSLTYTAGQMVRCRSWLVDDRLRMRAWLAAGTEPSTWPIDTTVPHLGPGLIGIQSWVVASNTNTLPVVFTVDNVGISKSFFRRLEGYIADIQPAFLPQPGGTTWSTVTLTVGGIGSRLEKNQSPAYSPLRRSVQLADIPPIAYWPLEDAEGATFGASAFPGGPKMLVSGPAVFSFSQGTPTEQYLSRYGTKPVVSVAAGVRLSAVVPTSAVVTEWAGTLVAEFFAPDVPAITEMRICQWETPSGSYNRWALVAPTSGGYVVRGYQDATSTVTNVAVYGTTFVGQATWTVEASQSGGNIFIELFVNDVSLASGSVAGTLAPVTKVVINPDKVNTTASVTPAGLKFVVGHVRISDEISVHDTPHYTVSETGTVVTAIQAWYQEPAHRRLERLCAEERVPFAFLGDPATTGMTLLNAQQDGSFTDLITAAAEAESGGLLYEAAFGYEYLPRTERYNQPAALTIDLSAYAYTGGSDPADVLVPQLDARAANYWTINRTNGGEGSYAASAAYRLRRGTIVEQRTLDVLTDTVLDDHAAWRTHLSVDGQGADYPSVAVDLAANPALIPAWLAVDVGSRVQRTNQPSIAGAGVIDQVVEGITETITPTSWTATLAATPGSVWDVGVWDDPATLWQPSVTTLTGSMTTTATSLTMTGEAWTTGAVTLTFDIDGEQMTVSNISGSGTGPYTVTITARSVNGVVKTHTAGAAVTLADPARWAL